MFAKKLVKSAAVAVVTVAVSVPLFASLLPANDVLAWDPDHTRIDFIVGNFSYQYNNPKEHSAGVTLLGGNGNVYEKTKLTIPATVTYGGETLAVTTIGKEAFKDNKDINTVVIEEGVSSIGKHAFDGCKQITDVTFPTTIEYFYEAAFKNCELLTSIDLSGCRTITPGGLHKHYAEKDINAVFSGCKRLTSVKLPTYEYFRTIPADWFKDCTSLKTITIPSNVGEIDCSCFMNDTKLETVKLTAGLGCIDDKAFSGCNSITTFTFPSTLKWIGSEAFDKCTALEKVNIPAGTDLSQVDAAAFRNTNIRTITFPESCSLKTISDQIFANCSQLTKVTINAPQVENFGANSFYNCPVLNTVTIPSGLKGVGENCFAYCPKLTDISLPDTVENIGHGAFRGCTSFTKFVVPPMVSQIGNNTFDGCKNLKSVAISVAASTIGDYAFNDCSSLSGNITLSESLGSIGKGTFKGCSKITGINIPSNVDYIGDQAFSGCASLKSINIPANVSRIYPSTFEGCTSLATVSISADANITDIDALAFSECTSLKSITLPSSLQTIGAKAFYKCSKLTRLDIPAGVTAINESLCEGCTALASVTLGSNTDILFAKAFKDCASLSSITIPSGVTVIPSECFAGSGLNSVNIPSTVTTIENKAFFNCQKLCSDNGVLKLPSNLKALGENSFTNCSNIKDVTIPSGVTSIPQNCFTNCTKLSKLNLNKVNTIGRGAFRGCSALGDVDFSNVRNFADEAFASCAIENVILPEGLSSIPRGCFSGNSAMVYAKIPSTVKTIGASAFAGGSLKAIEIPDSVTSVANDAFNNNKDLNKIKVENGQVTILQYLGSNQTVEVPDVIYGMNVTKIADQAFRDTKVRQVHVPATVKSIGSRAFQDCTLLLTVRIPESTTVADDAFYGCQTTYRIKDVDDRSVAITKFYGESKSVNIPKTLEGKTVVSIGDSAFENNNFVDDVFVPASVTSIGSKAFKGCGRADVSYPDSAKVGSQAFDGCESSKSYKGNAGPTDKPTPTTKNGNSNSTNDIRKFVDRIYTNVLNRQPEEKGAQYWTDELYAFRKSGAEVAQGFIFSEEFINRGTNNNQFVEILYRTFFDREPDNDGMNYWVGLLTSGTSRQDVANGFIFSQEWADTCAKYGIRSGAPGVTAKVNINPTAATVAFVERMYTTAMKREYDQSGRDYWAKELANFRITGEQVGASFFLSDEMNGYNLTNDEYINRLYKTFMDRDADQGGKDYWMSFLGEGHSRQEAVFGFTRSPEFQQKCVDARILPFQA